MAITMSITELESPKALCRAHKQTYTKVFLRQLGAFAPSAEVERTIDLKAAEAALGAEATAALLKRNKLRVASSALDPARIKEASDLKLLQPFVREVRTQWVAVEKVPPAKRDALLAQSNPDDRVTEWDLLSFEEMYATCAKCPLSWDKGRGCIASFGPTRTALPELAAKYGARLVASIPKLSESKEPLPAARAEELLADVKVLLEKLPLEGKAAARRYAGSLERLEALATTAKTHGVRFYFS